MGNMIPNSFEVHDINVNVKGPHEIKPLEGNARG